MDFFLDSFGHVLTFLYSLLFTFFLTFYSPKSLDRKLLIFNSEVNKKILTANLSLKNSKALQGGCAPGLLINKNTSKLFHKISGFYVATTQAEQST